METEPTWRLVGPAFLILGLLAFSYLNDSWPGEVARGVALFGLLGWIAIDWRRRGFPWSR
jgi:hypothetical protein